MAKCIRKYFCGRTGSGAYKAGCCLEADDAQKAPRLAPRWGTVNLRAIATDRVERKQTPLNAVDAGREAEASARK